MSPLSAVEEEKLRLTDIPTAHDRLLPNFQFDALSEPEQRITDKSSSGLASLWEEAVLQYRRTVALETSEEKVFCDSVAGAISGHEQYQRAVIEWRSFRKQSKSGKLQKAKTRVDQFMAALQDKIVTIDVLIGYPTQSVNFLH